MDTPIGFPHSGSSSYDFQILMRLTLRDRSLAPSVLSLSLPEEKTLPGKGTPRRETGRRRLTAALSREGTLRGPGKHRGFRTEGNYNALGSGRERSPRARFSPG